MLNAILKEAERREALELEKAARRNTSPLPERDHRSQAPDVLPENPERPDLSRFAPNFYRNARLDVDVMSLCVNLAAASGVLYTAILLLTGDFFRGYVILAFSLVLLLLNGIYRSVAKVAEDETP